MDAPAPDAIPYWVQFPAGIAIFIITLLGGWWQRNRGLKKEEERSSHVVLETASIADMQPLRDIGSKIDVLCRTVAELSEVIKEAIEDRRDEIERDKLIREGIRQGIADEVARLKASKPRMRPRPRAKAS